jgi:histidinol dehydrogenase
MIRTLQGEQIAGFLDRKRSSDVEVDKTVSRIIDDVRREGDAALHRYARELDGFEGDSFLIPSEEVIESRKMLETGVVDAIRESADNIRAVAEMQLPKAWESNLNPGLRVGQIVRPLQSVCAYIPSGRYPLVSTVLMTVIPAQVARVPTIAITSARPSREILGAASLLGLEKIYRLGGAQAIAAFALGTESIPRVDRIVGPGNAYVSAAKRLLAGEVSIDFVAGPTEIMIIAREGNSAWIAADMLAQAEHDVEAVAILLTTSPSLAEGVAHEIERQMATLPTSDVARESLRRNGLIGTVDSIDHAIALANEYAPEHLSIDDSSLLAQIDNAGSIFIGPCSPEAAGDYASGPNHVLPTSGLGRVRGGLSAADFVKTISVQELSSDALRRLSTTIGRLARLEGLEAHARSVEARLQ